MSWQAFSELESIRESKAKSLLECYSFCMRPANLVSNVLSLILHVIPWPVGKPNILLEYFLLFYLKSILSRKAHWVYLKGWINLSLPLSTPSFPPPSFLLFIFLSPWPGFFFLNVYTCYVFPKVWSIEHLHQPEVLGENRDSWALT